MKKKVIIAVLMTGCFLSLQSVAAAKGKKGNEVPNKSAIQQIEQQTGKGSAAKVGNQSEDLLNCQKIALNKNCGEKQTINGIIAKYLDMYNASNSEVKNIKDGCDAINNYLKTVPACNPISADFNFSPNGGSAPCEITFTNISEKADSYEWNFGDGGTSKTKNPKHTYAKAGNYTVTLDIKNAQGKTAKSQKSINVKEATKTVVPEVVTVSGYDLNKSSLSKKMEEQWESIIALLKQDKNAAYHFVIEGHTCDIGLDEPNMQLGKKRATVVKDYLVKNKISPDRIKEVISYGKERQILPIPPNATEKEKENIRKQNRRVVIVVEQ